MCLCFCNGVSVSLCSYHRVSHRVCLCACACVSLCVTVLLLTVLYVGAVQASYGGSAIEDWLSNATLGDGTDGPCPGEHGCACVYVCTRVDVCVYVSVWTCVDVCLCMSVCVSCAV